jgi:hypothetical protein
MISWKNPRANGGWTPGQIEVVDEAAAAHRTARLLDHGASTATTPGLD